MENNYINKLFERCGEELRESARTDSSNYIYSGSKPGDSNYFSQSIGFFDFWLNTISVDKVKFANQLNRPNRLTLCEFIFDSNTGYNPARETALKEFSNILIQNREWVNYCIETSLKTHNEIIKLKESKNSSSLGLLDLFQQNERIFTEFLNLIKEKNLTKGIDKDVFLTTNSSYYKKMVDNGIIETEEYNEEKLINLIQEEYLNNINKKNNNKKAVKYLTTHLGVVSEILSNYANVLQFIGKINTSGSTRTYKIGDLIDLMSEDDSVTTVKTKSKIITTWIQDSEILKKFLEDEDIRYKIFRSGGLLISNILDKVGRDKNLTEEILNNLTKNIKSYGFYNVKDLYVQDSIIHNLFLAGILKEDNLDIILSNWGKLDELLSLKTKEQEETTLLSIMQIEAINKIIDSEPKNGFSPNQQLSISKIINSAENNFDSFSFLKTNIDIALDLSTKYSKFSQLLNKSNVTTQIKSAFNNSLKEWFQIENICSDEIINLSTRNTEKQLTKIIKISQNLDCHSELSNINWVNLRYTKLNKSGRGGIHNHNALLFLFESTNNEHLLKSIFLKINDLKDIKSYKTEKNKRFNETLFNTKDENLMLMAVEVLSVNQNIFKDLILEEKKVYKKLVSLNNPEINSILFNFTLQDKLKTQEVQNKTNKAKI